MSDFSKASTLDSHESRPEKLHGVQEDLAVTGDGLMAVGLDAGVPSSCAQPHLQLGTVHTLPVRQKAGLHVALGAVDSAGCCSVIPGATGRTDGESGGRTC